MPPAITATGPPAISSSGQASTVGAADAELVPGLQRAERPGQRAHRADGVLERGAVVAGDRDRRLADAGERELVELARAVTLDAVDLHVQRHDVVALARDRDHLGRRGASGPPRRAPSGDGGAGIGASPSPSRSAAISSVRSIPTGHHAMQRPQPTQPDVPNCETHAPTLWVSHCR